MDDRRIVCQQVEVFEATGEDLNNIEQRGFIFISNLPRRH
jgi:hypothetical protein